MRTCAWGLHAHDHFRKICNQQWLGYHDRYWEKECRGRDLMPEQERFLDASRLDMVKAKFDAKK